MELEHPEITRCLITGYPDPETEEREELDEDREFEERREAELWGEI